MTLWCRASNITHFIAHKSITQGYQILFDKDHDFIFWFKNESNLESRTLLFVDQIAWESKKNIIKGVGVQISVFGSCDDLIEKN
jgi:hypothetical protein